VLAALVLGLTACGGDGDGAEDIVDRALTGDHDPVTSGSFELSAEVDRGGESFEGTIGGPFQGEGNAFPEFDIEADLSAPGEDFAFQGAVVSVANRGFIDFRGTDYEVDPTLFGIFTSYFESLQSESGDEGESLAERLDFNPTAWLTDLEDEGETEVDGTPTNHVSGAVDVDRVTEDLRSLADQVQSELGPLSGLGGTEIPDPSELGDLGRLVERATFDLYSGTDDDILRRFQLELEIGSGEGAGTVSLEFNLSDVNRPQTVEAPAGARPLSELLQRLGVAEDLGSLGSLGFGLGGLGVSPGGGGSGGSGGGGSGGAGAVLQFRECAASATSQDELEACVEQAR